MKKQLFGAAIITAAAFSACTDQDVMEVQTPESGRKMVENFVLAPSVSVDDATRLAYAGGKYKWETDDTVGALLMDDIITPSYYNDDKWENRFTMLDNIHTNFPFVKGADGLWNGVKTVCEGNYFVVYPYEDRDDAQTRETYVLRADKQVFDATKETLNELYVKSNKYVGYKQVKAGTPTSEMSTVDLYPVFEAQGIRLKNVATTPIKVVKVVLRSNAVANAAALVPSTQGFNIKEGYYAEKIADGTYADYKEVLQKDALSYVDLNNAGVTVDLCNKDLASQEYVDFIMMGHATGDISASEKNLTIYTNKGIVGPMEIGKIQTGELSPLTNVKTNRVVSKFGAEKAALRIEFDDTSIRLVTKLDIVEESDLDYLLDQLTEANFNGDAEITLKNDVSINKAQAEKIAKFNSLTVKDSWTYMLTLESDVPANVLDNIILDHVDLVNKGNITYKTYTPSVYIYNEGTVNLEAEVALIENYGVVNVKAGGLIDNLTKNNVINIEAKNLSSYGDIFAVKGTVNVNAAQTTPIVIADNKEITLAVNVATDVNITNGKKNTVVIASGIDYSGTLNNSGVVEVNGWMTGTSNVNNADAKIIIKAENNTGVKLATNAGVVDNTVLAPKANVQVVGEVYAKIGALGDDSYYDKYAVNSVEITANQTWAKDVFASSKALWMVSHIAIADGVTITVPESLAPAPAGTDATFPTVTGEKVTFTSGNPMIDTTVGFNSTSGNVVCDHVTL